MPRSKSVLVSMEVTVAGSSHNCRFNDGHRIHKGEWRLTIKEDGSSRHYCLSCARAFLAKGLERLRVLQTEVDEKLSSRANPA